VTGIDTEGLSPLRFPLTCEAWRLCLLCRFPGVGAGQEGWWCLPRRYAPRGSRPISFSSTSFAPPRVRLWGLMGCDWASAGV
jgi:hypothetical protein